MNTRTANRLTCAAALLPAIALAGCSSPTGDAATPTGTPATKQSPTPTAEPTPSPTATCSGLTGQEALDRWVSEVPPFEPGHPGTEHVAWTTEYSITDTYDECAELSWIVLDVEGATGSSPNAIMLFHHGELIGLASEEYFPYYPQVVGTAEGAVQVSYPWPSPHETPPNRSMRSISTFTWDEDSSSVRRDGDLPPVTDEERAERFTASLHVDDPADIPSAYPDAGGPVPADVIDLAPLTAEERAAIAVGPEAVDGVEAVFRTVSPDGIGCEFFTDGSAACSVATIYETMHHGFDEWGPVSMLHIGPDGAAQPMSPLPGSGVHNLETIAVPTVENGMAVRYRDLVCGMADEAVTCWNPETGHGGFVSGSRLTAF